MDRRRGFSLTELLVVVGVIIILISMMIVGIEGAYDYAMRLRCQHTMEHIWNACVLYATNHRNLLPPTWDGQKAWYEILVASGYIDNEKGVTCPTSDLPTGAGVGGYMVPHFSDMRNAQTKALDYIKSKQQANGAIGVSQPIAITSMAIVAYVGNGVSESHPVYGQTLARAIDYLLSNYNSSSKLFSTDMYTQGIALMAVGDALRYARVERCRTAAQGALTASVGIQVNSSNGGFGYSGAGSDMSVSSWAYQGIFAGRNAGLVPTGYTLAQVDAKATTFFDAAINKNESYQTYYSFPSSGFSSRYYRMTVANMSIRFLWGHKPEKPSWYTEPANYAAPNPIETSAIATSKNEDLYFQYRHVTRQVTGRAYREHILYAKGIHPDIEMVTGSHGPFIQPDLYKLYYLGISMWINGGPDWQEFIDALGPTLLAIQRADGSVSNQTVVWASGAGDYDCYATSLFAILTNMMIGVNTPGSKYYVSGAHSYAYNSTLGNNTRTPGATMIALIDYMKATISVGDPESLLAPRHSGKLNVIYCDGHSEVVYPDELTKNGMIREDLLTRDKDE